MKKALGALALAVATLAVVTSAAANPHQSDRIRAEARLFSQIVPTDPAASSGVGPGQQNRREVNCGAFGNAGRGVFDKDISCDDETVAPDNEMAIAVHPNNPNLLLAGSNDYQITFLGNTSILQVPSGYFFSRDGGGTWVDGELPLKGSLGGGDPAPAFDVKHNQMVFASLSFVCGQFAPVCSRGNIMFASSPLGPNGTAPTGQINWSDRVVANGSASDNGAQQLFLDKEWIAVDNYRLLPNGQPNPNYGNIYIVYQQFRTEKGVYDESPVMFIKSEDGGNQWTLPVEISGRNPAYCTFQDDPDDTADTNGPNSTQGTAEGPDDPFACDQDSFSIPAVAPDGTLYVQWDNEQNLAAYELPQRYDSQVLLIKSQDGGDTFVGEQPTAANQQGCVRIEAMAFGPNSSCIVPLHVVNKEDSYDFFSQGANGTAVPDYPINVSGRTTMTGHQFRVNSAGNLAVGPNASSPLGYRLWTVFADNFNGVRPGNGLASEDPPGAPALTPITNTDVFYAFSDDGGLTWIGGDTGGVSGGRLQANPPDTQADQWFPWSDTNKTNGALVVGYMDANVDGPVRNQYGFTNVTVPVGGSPGVPLVVSSANSNPNNSLFFNAGVTGCQFCATFIGDYNGLVVDSNGQAHSVWTDMRRNAAPPFPNRAVQDAFYARQPTPPTP